jgi:glycosyltransferase involved in cell wall biosynthesis
LKILFLSTLKFTDAGGVVSHFKILGKGFEELGHKVNYMTLSTIPKIWRELLIYAPSQLLKKISSNLSSVYKFSMIKFMFIYMLKKKQPKEDYDLWISQDYFLCDAAKNLKNNFNVPLLYTVHSYVVDMLSGLNISKSCYAERYFIDLDKRSYEIADKIIAVDSRIKKHIIDSYSVNQDKIVVKINFVDIKDFKPRIKEKLSFRKKFKLPRDKLLILCPRRLVEKNGVIYAAMAAKFLKKYLKSDFRIIFIGGGGPEVGKVKKILKKDKTRSNIIILPVISHKDMKYLYNAVDIVIVPSVHLKGLEEATSISALEAMASGIPVIASNIGGLIEMIEDGNTGFLIEQKNPLMLAKKVVQVSKSNNKNIIKNARNFIIQECSHLKRAKEYVNLFNEIKRS